MKWMGLLVLMGVLTMMIVVGGLLFVFQQSFGAILPIVLPTIYGVVIFLGEEAIAHYVYRDERIPRPYFAHVRTPDTIRTLLAS